MYKEYYFYHAGLGRVLPPIFSNSIDNAWDILLEQHAWANPTSNNCTLTTQ